MTLVFNVITNYPTASGKLYAILRWFMCPFHLMEQYLPRSGVILDLGCGEGVFSQYVARTSADRRIIGIDTDEKKFTIASEAARSIPNLRFIQTNALAMNFDRVSGIVMSDFLHHLTPDNQEELLMKSTDRLRSGGVLLIKEIHKKDKIRSRLSRFWDFIFYPKDKIYYCDIYELAGKIKKRGFSVTVKRAALHFPGSTYLLICSKKTPR